MATQVNMEPLVSLDHKCSYCQPSEAQKLSRDDQMALEKGDLDRIQHFLEILRNNFRSCDGDCVEPFARLLHTETIIGGPSLIGQKSTESFLHLLMWKSADAIVNSHESHNRFKLAMATVLDFLEQKSGESERNQERVRRLLALKGKQGKTVIHLAAMKWGNQAVRRLLKLGANISEHDVLGEVAATKINPDLVEEFLDSKWDPHIGDPDTDDYSIVFDFGFLQKWREDAPPMLLLSELAQSPTHRKLLAHPVFTTFLALQWECLSIPFYLNLLLSTLAFSSANLFILRNYGGFSLQHLSLRTDWDSCEKEGFPSAADDPLLNAFGVFLGIFTTILLLREAVQIVAEKFSYFCSLENWIELYFCFSSFVLLGYTYTDSQNVCHMRALAATIILASWVLVVNMVARHPRIQRVNIYITMFFKVMCYFVGIFLAFIPYIIAFGLFFYVSLHKDEPEKDDLAPQKTYTDLRKQILNEINRSSVFLDKDKQDILKLIEDKAEEKGEFMNKAGSSIIKALAMFVGELEFSDIPLEGLPYFSHMFFMIFIIIFVVVLMNYLTGIAVNETSEIRENAEVHIQEVRVRMLRQAEMLHLLLKKVAPRWGLELKQWDQPHHVEVQVKRQDAPCWYSCLTKESWQAALLAQAKDKRVDDEKEQKVKQDQIENMKAAMEMVVTSKRDIRVGCRCACTCSRETRIL